MNPLRFRFLAASLSLAIAPLLSSAPNVEQALEAMDITPSSGFSVSGLNSLAIDSEALANATSLALTRTENNSGSAPSTQIYGYLDENALVEFYVKERNIGRHFDYDVRLGSRSVTTSLSEADANGWRKASLFVVTAQSEKLEIHLQLQSDEPNADASLLIDGFSINPGNALFTESQPGGLILTSPQKATYEKGESVAATFQANPGYRFSKFNVDAIDARGGIQLNSDYSEQTLQRSSINLLVRTHMRLSAKYDAQIPCEGAEAWSVNPSYDSQNYDPERPQDFVTKARVESLDRPGVLAFELSAPRPGYVELTWPGLRTGESIAIPAGPNENTFVPIQIPFASGPGFVEFFFNTNYTGNPTYAQFEIRNLRYLATPGTVLDTIGLGQVTAESLPPSQTGEAISRFTADPAEGWAFIGWQNVKGGTFISTEGSIELSQEQPSSLIAVFGQEFSTDDLTLLVAHDGRILIEQGQTEDGYIPLSLRYGTDETLFATSEPIPVYAKNLPAGAVEWLTEFAALPNTATNQEASGLFFITDYITVRSPETSIYKFRYAPPTPDPTDYQLTVTAEPNTYSQSSDSSEPVETVSLSINEAYRDQFVRWYGDLISSKPQIEVTVTADLEIAAYFQETDPFESLIPLHWTSPYLPENQGDSDKLISKLSPTYPSTLSGYAEGPCRLKFRVIGEHSIYLTTPTSANPQYLSYDGPGNSAELRVLIEEAGPFSIDFIGKDLDLEFLGIYQSVLASSTAGGRVDVDYIESNEYLVGSTASATVTPEDGFRFHSWISPDISPEARSVTVKLYEDVTFAGRFQYDLGSDLAEIATESLDSWDYQSQSGLFEYRQTPPKGDPAPFLMNTSGSGLIRFRVGASTEVEVLLDDQPLKHRHGFSLEENTWLSVVPIPDGNHKVEIRLRASTAIEFSAYESDLSFSNLEFLPGYAILAGFNAHPEHPFSVAPSSLANVFPAGSKVTITAPTIDSNAFDRWSGDVTGTNPSIEVTLDRHLSIAPIYTPTKLIDPSSMVSSGANVLTYTQEQEQLFIVRGSSQPCVFTFTIPAGQELQFATEGTLGTAMVWQVSGEPAVDKYAGSIIAERPSPQQRTATLTIDIPIDSSAFVKLEAFQTRDRFFLGGYFGSNTEDVQVSRFKESYAWGEQVTISLGDSFPSESRFYDLVTYRPAYDQTEWPSSDFVRQYQVSIDGDTYVTGSIGPAFTRSAGQITAISDTPILTSTTPDPRGTLSKQIASDSICRIHAGQKKHLQFYLQVPAGDLVVFNSALSGYDLPIEGTGEWMQIGMPVPADRDFLSFEIIDGGIFGEESYFSLIQTLSGYAPPHISFGPGTIEITPAQGVSSPSHEATLRAIPNDDDTTHLWITPIESDAPAITLQANSDFPAFSYFETSEPPVSPTQLPWELKAIGSDPEFENTETAKTIALKDYHVTLTRQVAGQKVLELVSQTSNSSSLRLTIGESSYEVVHPQTSSSVSHFYPIPGGSHTITLSYDPNGSDSPSYLLDLKLIDAFLVEFDDSQAQVIQYPIKDYYLLGEPVTLLANPPKGFQFDSWTGTIESADNPLQISSIDKHHVLQPKLLEETVLSASGETWTPKPHPSGRYGYEALLYGPGTVYLNVGARGSPRLRVNGILATPHAVNYDRSFFLIPEGKHRVDLLQNRSLKEAPATYVKGFKIDLSSEIVRDGFQLVPEQISYQKGDQVTVDWPGLPGHPKPQVPVFQHPSGAEVLLPKTFTITDHLVGQLYAKSNTPMEDLFVSPQFFALPENSSVEFLSGGDILEGLDLTFYHQVLHLQLNQRGTLSFTFEGYPGPEYNPYRHHLRLDGQTILQLQDGESYEINIPAGGHTLSLVSLSDSQEPTDRCVLRNLTFTPTTESDPFRDLLENISPAKTFATSSGLLPSQDLDGDGLSNQRELSIGKEPGIYDLPLWIYEDQSSPSQILERFNSSNPYALELMELPTTIVELIPISEYEYSEPSDVYALTFIPSGIAYDQLSLQIGTLDPDTERIYWSTVGLVPAAPSEDAVTTTGTLARLKMEELSGPPSLVRLSLNQDL